MVQNSKPLGLPFEVAAVTPWVAFCFRAKARTGIHIVVNAGCYAREMVPF